MRQQNEERGRYLTQADCQRIVERVFALAGDKGYTSVFLQSWLNGELRWARNRVSLAGDRCNLGIQVMRDPEEGDGSAGFSTNQLDDTSLEAGMRYAERRMEEHARKWGFVDRFNGALKSPVLERPITSIWSDTTMSVTGEARGTLARLLTEEAENKGMISAGYLEMRATSGAYWSNLPARKGDPIPAMTYQRLTQAQCSMTVRHPRGTGSGWAGKSSFDSDQVDGSALARRALDKCIASIDPVRIEPGRFTVVLEPQAVSQLLDGLMGGDESSEAGPLSRYANEGRGGYGGPFMLTRDDALRIWRTKLGLKVVDERITITHNPSDPALGVVSYPGLQPITWIQNGVLTSLHHPTERYAPTQLQRLSGQLWRPSYHVSGGATTVEEMITTTKRGLLVTRFSGIGGLDAASLLITGTTRDGLWLIENGKITKAVWNMRFTESPLFALNQIEQLGVPQPVFRPVLEPGRFQSTPAIVPVMKINDFSFTSLVDAV